ncbi:MAG: co-chaperone GroES [Gammaproteobacteria bacterium]|nr:MAG: co-chaperone GroES [Gammaproteobacteria bacterium]
MALRPLHDRVIIKREEEETTSAGGIVLPGSATEKPSRGEVIAVGAGKKLDNGELSPMAVKVGDKVLFGKFSGTEVEADKEKLLVMREDEIIAIIE